MTTYSRRLTSTRLADELSTYINTYGYKDIDVEIFRLLLPDIRTNIYLLKNHEVIVSVNGFYSYVFSTRSHLLNCIKEFKKSGKDLKLLFPIFPDYEEIEFIEHAPILQETLHEIIGINKEILDGSDESLEVLDEIIEQIQEPELLVRIYLPLLAYCGYYFLKVVEGGKWILDEDFEGKKHPRIVDKYDNYYDPIHGAGRAIFGHEKCQLLQILLPSQLSIPGKPLI